MNNCCPPLLLALKSLWEPYPWKPIENKYTVKSHDFRLISLELSRCLLGSVFSISWGLVLCKSCKALLLFHFFEMQHSMWSHFVFPSSSAPNWNSYWWMYGFMLRKADIVFLVTFTAVISVRYSCRLLKQNSARSGCLFLESLKSYGFFWGFPWLYFVILCYNFGSQFFICNYYALSFLGSCLLGWRWLQSSGRISYKWRRSESWYVNCLWFMWYLVW